MKDWRNGMTKRASRPRVERRWKWRVSSPNGNDLCCFDNTRAWHIRRNSVQAVFEKVGKDQVCEGLKG